MGEHEEYIILLSAGLDGELSPEEEEKLKAHLAVCPRCRGAEEELRALREAFRTLPRISPPDGFRDRVMAAVAQEEQEGDEAERDETLSGEKVLPFPGKGKTPWKRWLATAAVLAVVVGAGALSLNRGGKGGSGGGAAAPEAILMEEVIQEEAPAGGAAAAKDQEDTPEEEASEELFSANDDVADLSGPKVEAGGTGGASGGGADAGSPAALQGESVPAPRKESDTDSLIPQTEEAAMVDAAPWEVPVFSFAQVQASWGERGSRVRGEGFVNTAPAELPTAEEAIQRARKECSMAGAAGEASYDPDAGVWQVVFSGEDGQRQSVYLDDLGITLFLVEEG